MIQTNGVEEKIGELSALLTHICESPIAVNHKLYRAWGLLQACIELEVVTFDVVHLIYEQLHVVPYYPDRSDYQHHQTVLSLTLDILADLPLNIELVQDESILSIIANSKEAPTLLNEVESLFWLIDENLLVPNAAALYRMAYRLVRANDHQALELFGSRFSKYVAMAQESHEAVANG